MTEKKYPKIPDEQPVDSLVNAAIEGDRQAFERLYFLMEGTLKAMLYREWNGRLVGLEGRSDIAQDCLARAWEKRSQLRDRSLRGFQSWVLGIVRNHIRDRAHAWKTHLEVCVRINGGSNDAMQIPQKEESLGVQAKVERVWKALNCLENEKQREAVRLNKLEQWTACQIAAHMGISKSAVFGLLKRGKLELKRLLENERVSYAKE